MLESLESPSKIFWEDRSANIKCSTTMYNKHRHLACISSKVRMSGPYSTSNVQHKKQKDAKGEGMTALLPKLHAKTFG